MGFAIVGDAAVISGGTSPSKPAVVLTGGDTDDGLAIDTWATDRKGTDTQGTITAWICPGDKTSTMSIISMNDANVVEFMDFKIAAGKIAAAVTDATVAKWATATTSVVIEPHKWVHVALVQDAKRPHIYLNGVEQACTDTTTTALGYWVDQLAGVDKGYIGCSSIGGAGAIGEEWVGGIGEVKYWSTGLTAAQIMDDYMGNGTTTNLTDQWKMIDLTNSVTSANAATIISDAYLSPTYNEFISKVRKFGAVTADFCGFSECNGKMSALIVNAA